MIFGKELAVDMSIIPNGFADTVSEFMEHTKDTRFSLIVSLSALLIVPPLSNEQSGEFLQNILYFSLTYLGLYIYHISTSY